MKVEGQCATSSFAPFWESLVMSEFSSLFQSEQYARILTQGWRERKEKSSNSIHTGYREPQALPATFNLIQRDVRSGVYVLPQPQESGEDGHAPVLLSSKRHVCNRDPDRLSGFNQRFVYVTRICGDRYNISSSLRWRNLHLASR
jgi:hypothetical protein